MSDLEELKLRGLEPDPPRCGTARPLPGREQVTLRVTGKYITAGLTGDCCRCPIALAANAKFPGVRAAVTVTKLLLPGHEGGEAWWMDMRGRGFVMKFDEDMEVRPFTLTAYRAYRADGSLA